MHIVGVVFLLTDLCSKWSMKKDCSKDFTTNLRDIIQTNSITNSLSFFLLFRRNQKTKITFLGLSVKVGMRNRGTEWGEWWECVESGWECRESGWFFVRMFVFIASAKIPEREKSISTLSFYGQLLDYNSNVFSIVYQSRWVLLQVNENVFMFLRFQCWDFKHN